MNKFEQLLKGFNKNQLKEINDFLNSADGIRLKNQIASANKDKLIRELSGLDENELKKRISSMNAEDLKRIMKDK